MVHLKKLPMHSFIHSFIRPFIHSFICHFLVNSAPYSAASTQLSLFVWSKGTNCISFAETSVSTGNNHSPAIRGLLYGVAFHLLTRVTAFLFHTQTHRHIGRQIELWSFNIRWSLISLLLQPVDAPHHLYGASQRSNTLDMLQLAKTIKSQLHLP